MKKPIVIMCGLSGSGKTYNAKLLASKLAKSVVVSPGIARAQLGINTYSRKDTPLLLASIIKDMEKHHDEQKISILDANLKSVDIRQCFYDLGKHLNVDVILVEHICPEEVSLARMRSRSRITMAENPQERQIYLDQKKVWQDTLMDLSVRGNDHVNLVRFDSDQKIFTIIKETQQSRKFIQEMILLLK